MFVFRFFNSNYKWEYTPCIDFSTLSHVPKYCFILFYFIFPQPQCLKVNKTSLRENFLTEEMVADHWECNIQTVNQCTQPNSIPATFKIFPFKPRGEYPEASSNSQMCFDCQAFAL